MQLQNYIQALLYRYDCVIIPNFGGLITNTINARIDADHSFYPPTKELGFNSNLTNNDGLLTNEVAIAENISQNEANILITNTVKKWITQLKSGALFLEKVGSFQLNEENQIEFTPQTSVNYLPSSFGLSTYKKPQIIRANAQPTLIPKQKESSGVPAFIKYAATAAILLTLSGLGWVGYQDKQQEKQYVKQQEMLQNKIQSATFTIDNPLPTIELNVTKKHKSYHVVAGAFEFEKNAHKKVNQLKRKGYNSAYILGKNKWGLTQVVYDSYANEQDALESLKVIRKADAREAWLFVTASE